MIDFLRVCLRRCAITTAAALFNFCPLGGIFMSEISVEIRVSSVMLGAKVFNHPGQSQLGPGSVPIIQAQLFGDLTLKFPELSFQQDTRSPFDLQLRAELLDALGDGRLERPLQRQPQRADLGAHLRDRRHSPAEAGPVRGRFGASRLMGLSLSSCLSFWLLRPGNVLCFPMCSLHVSLLSQKCVDTKKKNLVGCFCGS